MLKYTWICLNNARTCVNIPEYLLICFENPWIYLNKQHFEYARVLNKPKVKAIEGHRHTETYSELCPASKMQVFANRFIDSELRFWICQGYTRLWIIRFMGHVWKYSENQRRIQRFWKGAVLRVGHHGWRTKKILGFRWSKKAK